MILIFSLLQVAFVNCKFQFSCLQFLSTFVYCNFCRKRHSTSDTSTHQENSASKSIEPGLLYDGQSIHSPTNAALLLENIKQEAGSLDGGYPEISHAKTEFSPKRIFSADIHGVPDVDSGFDSIRHSLKACKKEADSLGDSAETIFTLFASMLDSSLQGAVSISCHTIPQYNFSISANSVLSI